MIDVATQPWCWSKLRTNDTGVLTYRTVRGISRVTVRYHVRDRQIVVPIAANHSGWGAAGGEVSLDVTGTGTRPASRRWSVRASAVALRLPWVGLMPPARSRGNLPVYGLDPADLLRQGLLLANVRVRGFHESTTTAAANCVRAWYGSV